MTEDFGDAMRARKRRGGKSRRRVSRCEVKKVRGGRYMLLCPHKRPKFISESRAKSFRKRR